MIHREGSTSLFIAALFCLAVNAITFVFFRNSMAIVLGGLFVSLALMAMLLQFFRNPGREIMLDAQAVICPADGKVVVIEQVLETEFLKEKCIQISIFMSPFNVHVNRNPVSGRVVYLKYHPGKFLVAWHPKSSTDNERTTVVYQTHTGARVLLRQIAGAMARRIVFYLKENHLAEQGKEMGFIKFGSRVDLLLPADSEVCVSLGQKVSSARTVIARLPA